jgi:hypothetical protein
LDNRTPDHEILTAEAKHFGIKKRQQAVEVIEEVYVAVKETICSIPDIQRSPVSLQFGSITSQIIGAKHLALFFCWEIWRFVCWGGVGEKDTCLLVGRGALVILKGLTVDLAVIAKFVPKLDIKGSDLTIRLYGP